MTLDPQIAAFLAAGVAAGTPPPYELPLAGARAGMRAAGAAMWGEPATVGAVRDLEIPGPVGPLGVRLYVPVGHAAGTAGTLVWLHGGGWVLGDLDSHDALCRSLAERSGSIVAAVDYRLAPEHVFPAAVDDAWAATRWAASPAAAAHGLDPTRVAVGGDSAGANLAAVAALRARDAGLALRFQALSYPVAEGTFASESYSAFASGYGLTSAAMQWYWETYAPGEAKLHPDASVLRAASLAGAAPALVQTAEYDVLRSEGEAYAARLAGDGVTVAHTRWAGLTHGYLRMTGVASRASDAVDEVAAAVSAALV